MGEKEWFEFKSNDATPSKLGQNISAIANIIALLGRPYGYVVWGVHDKNHTIIGTSFNPDSKKVKSDDLIHWISQRLKPSVEIRFYKGTVDGKPVVVLVIPATIHLPVNFENEAYIRVGSHTRKLSNFPEKEKRLWRVLDIRIFEEEIATERLQDQEILRMLDYESYFDMINRTIPQDHSVVLQILQSEQFIRQRDDHAWDILNLGFLAFARNLEDAPSLRRKPDRIVKYSGTSRWNQSQEHELKAGYASGFSKIMDCIRTFTPIDETFNGGIRKQELRFPEIPVREVIANALIHQDLTVRGAGPLIEIFEDRIEVVNPGRPLVDVKFFVSDPPKSRNEALAKLLHRFGICEERGIGWDRIVQEIELLQLPAPRIEVVSDNTRITLYAPKPLSTMSLSERVNAIYLHACLQYVNGTLVTNTSIRKRFGIEKKNSSKASRFLSEALTAGVIVQADSNLGRKFMKYIPYWARDSGDE